MQKSRCEGTPTVCKIVFKTMVTATTKQIKVTVETEFQPGYSSAAQQHLVFTYRVTIENRGEHRVQLLRRCWQIYDPQSGVREVEGEGVVGLQPIIAPGEAHQYVSGCSLKSQVGKMKGTYLMQRLDDRSEFYIAIPEFVMTVPHLLN